MNHIRITVADISDCGINLMYLPFEPSAQMPKFREGAKHPAIEDNGFVLYYTDQCPYTYYWVPRVQEVAKEHGIPFKVIHITDKESAQNLPAPTDFSEMQACDAAEKIAGGNNHCNTKKKSS